ncbi:MAG: phosphotransferase [Halioglobus sp.]|nr:phosphotransferase [Halioglobus sp.]
MLQSLPSNIRLKLDQTLAQWPQWNCDPVVTRAPTIIKVLASGISNHSILVESEQHFVVRIDGIKPSKFGLSRKTEWHTLQAAYNAELTPRPCYFNPDLGCLVTDYLAPDVAQGLVVTDVARLLHKIHRLPPTRHRLHLADRIARYEKQLKRTGQTAGKSLRQFEGKISGILDDISQQPGESVLCHNDLLRANRIYSDGKLWAIDWEYCAMASPWYDIAVIVNGDALPAHETEGLLKAYLGRAANDWERSMLYRYGCVYRYLELLWYQALEKPILDALAVEAKCAVLESMLQESAA